MCILISLRCIRVKLEHHGNSLVSSFKTHFIDSHKFERIAKLLKRVSSRNASLFVLGGNQIMCDRCRARPETDAWSWTGDERGRRGHKTRSDNLSAESKWPISHVTVLRTQYNTHTHTRLILYHGENLSFTSIAFILSSLYFLHLNTTYWSNKHFLIFWYYFVPVFLKVVLQCTFYCNGVNCLTIINTCITG